MDQLAKLAFKCFTTEEFSSFNRSYSYLLHKLKRKNVLEQDLINIIEFLLSHYNHIPKKESKDFIEKLRKTIICYTFLLLNRNKCNKLIEFASDVFIRIRSNSSLKDLFNKVYISSLKPPIKIIEYFYVTGKIQIGRYLFQIYLRKWNQEADAWALFYRLESLYSTTEDILEFIKQSALTTIQTKESLNYFLELINK